MKKVISFAAALMIVAAGAAALPKLDYSVAYANSDSSAVTSGLDDSTGSTVNCDTEKTKELAEKLKLDMKVYVILKTGGEMLLKNGGVDADVDNSSIDNGYLLSKEASVSKAELEKVLDGAGKTFDDIHTFAIYYSVDYSGEDLESYNAKQFVSGGLYSIKVCDNVRIWRDDPVTTIDPRLAPVSELKAGETRLEGSDESTGMWSTYLLPTLDFALPDSDTVSRVYNFKKRKPTYDEVETYNFTTNLNIAVPKSGTSESSSESSKDESSRSDPKTDSGADSSGSVLSEGERMDREKAAAEEVGKNLVYSIEPCIVCKDGTYIPANKTMERVNNTDKPTFAVDISREEIISILKGTDRSFDDFKTLGCRVKGTLPASMNVDTASRIMLGGRVRWDEIDKKGKVTGGYSLQSFLENGVLADTFEFTARNYHNYIDESEFSRMTFIVENAAVYAHADRKTGDINGDGVTNVTDISKLAAHVKGIRPLYSEPLKYADINSDGRVDVSDIIILAKIVKGQK